ncbi:MAG TPA: M56 and MltD domain-containing protein [Steroidobacteraceae bacterium]
MSLVGIPAIAIVSCYVYVNLLMVGAAALLAGIRALNGALPRPLTHGHLLAMGRILAVSSVLLPCLAMWHGGSGFTPLKAQIWAAPSMRAASAAVSTDARIDIGVDAQHASLPVQAATTVVLVLFASGLLLTVLPLLSEVAATRRVIRDAHALRSIGSVRILVSDSEQVPFATWVPGRAYIVLPAALLLRPADVRLALRHEGQHHRQADTQFLYAALLGRMLLGINPAVRWLAQQLLELQEFACDEALARRPDHSVHAYCACLLRVAEAALGSRPTAVRSFMASSHPCALRRRMEAAYQRPVRTVQAPGAACVGMVAVAVLMALSVVIATPVQDRRLSRTDAEQLVAATPGSSTWGLRANDAVLRQLNLLLGTPDGRKFLNSSIARMHSYEPGVLAALKKSGLPPELRVVPLAESGYQNLPSRRGPGAGLWMFIGRTARNYGLQVSTARDERLDVQAETRAAMHMLSDLRRRFQSWPLALMAYNSGASKVEAGMNATHSRDAWALYQAGYGNDPDYLARTTAVMLILAHPRLLD